MAESWMEDYYATGSENGPRTGPVPDVPLPSRPDPDPEWTDADETPAPDAPAGPRPPITLREALSNAFAPFRAAGFDVVMTDMGKAAEDTTKAMRRLKLYLQVTDPESGDTITELEMTGPSGVLNDAGSAALSAIHYSEED
jgi:hypothetical protein